MTRRLPCRAVFLDAGGVIVLPDRHLLAAALARAGINIDPALVPLAHYRAVRTLDRALGHAPNRPHAPGHPVAPGHPAHRSHAPATRADYPRALFPQFGIMGGQAAEALAVWERLADRRRAGRVLWSEPTPGATQTIDALMLAGVMVVIVTNSDGHAEENLRDCGFGGIPVIDSVVVGAAKPDPRIFHAALARAGAPPTETVHVGDSLANDVAGARAAGITPIHFDPLRACRATDHRHVRSLAGIRRHVKPCA